MYFFPQGRNVTQYQFNDDVSWTKGKHTAKFGASSNGMTRPTTIPRFCRSFPLPPNMVPRPQPPADPTALPLDHRRLFRQRQHSECTCRLFLSGRPLPLRNTISASMPRTSGGIRPISRLTSGVRLEHNSNPVCQVNCFGRFATSYNKVTADLDTPYNSVIASGLHQAFNGLQTVAVDPRIGFTFSPNQPFQNSACAAGSACSPTFSPPTLPTTC